MSDPTDDPLAVAWSALESHWADEERHRAFVGLAIQLGRLHDAAMRYRAAEADPVRAPLAAQGRERVLAAAMAQLDALPRTSPEQVRRRGYVLLPLTLLGSMVAVSFAIARATHTSALVSPAAIALEIIVVALLPWQRLLR